jgi:manganese transport protein
MRFGGAANAREDVEPRADLQPRTARDGDGDRDQAAAPAPAARRPPATALLFGPAFVAAVAYVDPGNFATNVAGGAASGYTLLWVVLGASLAAMPIQYLSAKLGVVTGHDLAEMCALRLPRAARLALWLQAEVVVMATDLAEFVGAAVGLHLLFGMAPLPAAAVTAVLAFALLALQTRGYRPYELAITALLAVICLGFVYEMSRAWPGSRALTGLVPRFSGDHSVTLAAGIVGATVMPHAIYLHSALTSRRAKELPAAQRTRAVRWQRWDVGFALGLAGLVNMTILAMAATLFAGRSRTSVDTLQQAHAALGRAVDGTAALVFAVALLASGISSSSAGTYAGQVVMAGFVRRRIPLGARRLVTMLPAIVVLGLGIDPTGALVFSQVVLSFGVPFALVPLLVLTSDRRIMGVHRNHRATTVLVWMLAVVVTALDCAVIGQLVRG